MKNKVKDEVLQEIWEIKDSLANQTDGDLKKLVDTIKKDAQKAKMVAPVVDRRDRKVA